VQLGVGRQHAAVLADVARNARRKVPPAGESQAAHLNPMHHSVGVPHVGLKAVVKVRAPHPHVHGPHAARHRDLEGVARAVNREDVYPVVAAAVEPAVEAKALQRIAAAVVAEKRARPCPHESGARKAHLVPVIVHKSCGKSAGPGVPGEVKAPRLAPVVPFAGRLAAEAFKHYRAQSRRARALAVGRKDRNAH